MSKCVKCGSNSVPGGNDLCWNCGWPWGGNFKVEPPTLKSDPPNSSLRDRLIAVVTAASPVSRRFIAGDGYMSIAIRSDEDAAAIAVDAVIDELSLMIDDSYRISYGNAFIVHGYYEVRDDD